MFLEFDWEFYHNIAIIKCFTFSKVSKGEEDKDGQNPCILYSNIKKYNFYSKIKSVV